MACPNCTGHLGDMNGVFYGFVWGRMSGWKMCACPCLCKHEFGITRQDAVGKGILLVPDFWPCSLLTFEKVLNFGAIPTVEGLEIPPNAPNGIKKRIAAKYRLVTDEMLESITFLKNDIRNRNFANG